MTIRAGLAGILQADIYGITAEEHSMGRNNIEVVEQMLTGGVRVIQYREKDKKAREKYLECMKIREMTREAGAVFIVNDDVDIAILACADGVHVGQDDLPPEEVRRLVGEEMVIGLSTHSPEQARAALAGGIDYIGVGPIFATRTKKDVCDPVGLEYLEYVVRKIKIPAVAIGGIKEHNIGEVARRGARCFALVTEIVGAADIPAKVEALRLAAGLR
jgi:thiamine-phosphate pyrophosphorylase